MKKVFGITLGGLQQKIMNLVLIFLLALIAVFMGITIYQTNNLNKIVSQTRDEQQEAIGKVSGNTMQQVIQSSMTKTTALQAYIADDMFSDIKTDVATLQSLATGLFEHKDSFEPFPANLPDKSLDGQLSAQVLYEEGVDYTKSELLGVAAHMSDTMIAMCKNSDYLNNCFVGLADGTLICVDDNAGSKYDENGKLTTFAVRQRPWYTGAVEAGELWFSGIETDTYTDKIGVECAAPIYLNGELVGVVGADLFLDAMGQYVKDSANQGGYVAVINNEGQVIFAPEGNGIFEVTTSDMAQDLRNDSNTELADFITNALNERTQLTTVTINDKAYYMAGSPMNTVGWAVVSFIEKSITEQPTQIMLDEYDRINKEATDSFESGAGRSKQTMLIMIAAILALGSVGALVVANRIVRPVEKMTKRMADISGTDQAFEMDDAYRTGDEVEVLAQSLAELSTKTRQYIRDITEITKEKERLGTELELARKIQADMLPNLFPAFPDRTEFSIYASMTPAKEVGGDFYDFFLVDNDHLGMVMADVSGKGVPAALFMMMSKILVNNFAMQGNSPARALELTNEVICQNNDEEMFVTVWLGVLEISTGKVVAANAGHEYPVIKKPGGKYELLKDKHGFVVGGMDGIRYKEYEFQLEKGGALFLYTDGVPEATNANHELFGTDRLLETMNSLHNEEPKDMLTGVKKAIDEFVGEAEQFDDLTMLGLILN